MLKFLLVALAGADLSAPRTFHHGGVGGTVDDSTLLEEVQKENQQLEGLLSELMGVLVADVEKHSSFAHSAAASKGMRRGRCSYEKQQIVTNDGCKGIFDSVTCMGSTDPSSCAGVLTMLPDAMYAQYDEDATLCTIATGDPPTKKQVIDAKEEQRYLTRGRIQCFEKTDHGFCDPPIPLTTRIAVSADFCTYLSPLGGTDANPSTCKVNVEDCAEACPQLLRKVQSMNSLVTRAECEFTAERQNVCTIYEEGLGYVHAGFMPHADWWCWDKYV